MGRGTLIFCLTLGLLLPVVIHGDPPTADCTVDFAGYWKGTGQGQLKNGTLSLSGNVQDESGNQGSISASGLSVDDKNHFTGTGTVLGKTVKVSGRVDNPSGKDKQLKTLRIVGTFSTSDGHYGRFAGYVPVKGHSSPPGGGGD